MISTYAFKDLMTLPQTMHLRGVCPQFGTFTINFIDEQGLNLLHFSFRIDQQMLVVNENTSGDWGEEFTVANVVFPKGRPFVIRLDLADENAVRLSLDDHLLSDFKWRADVRRASRVDLTDVDFALFRESDSYKTMPEDTEPLPAAPSSRPIDDIALSDLYQRLDDLTAVQNDLVGQIGDLAGAMADLKTQYRDIAVGMQALLSREGRSVNDASSAPGKAA